MTPFVEPEKGDITGVTTDVLVARYGPIVARGCNDTYQFIEFAGDVVYESFRFGMTVWLPWSRRPCHSGERLARHLGIVREQA